MMHRNVPDRSARPLQVGYFMSVAEGAAENSWADLKARARHVEEAGFDSLWIGDHLMIPQPVAGGSEAGRWECWSILSALAAITSRVELGALVICTGFRNPAVLAKMADTVDEISDGRLILGLGAGYYEREFEAFGLPFDHRMARFEEALQIIHGLLRTSVMDFQGQYYQARDCELRPRGSRPAGPPILIGARANRPRALRLTAQYADYWNMFFTSSEEGLPAAREAVDAACEKAARDPGTLMRTVSMNIDLAGSHNGSPAVREYRAARAPICDTTDAMADRLRRLAEAGISHVQLWLEPNTMAGIDEFRPVLELLDQGR